MAHDRGLRYLPVEYCTIMSTNVCPQLGKIELSLFMRATTITTKGSIIVGKILTHAH